MSLAADIGGHGAPLLVLLHGLGATREVWRGLCAQLESRWPGRWIAPDLPGHGRSPALASYAPAEQAAAVAETLGEAGLQGHPLVVLGHSMGGVVGLALASGAFGPRPTHTLALGIKVAWTEAEAAAMAKRAAAPPKLFADRAQAIERHLKVAGLEGLIDPGSEAALAGVAATPDGWGLAMDPATQGVGPPDMAALIAAAAGRISLACGAHDPLVDVAALQHWSPTAQALDGLGHNAMVEDPERVWAWVACELFRSDPHVH